MKLRLTDRVPRLIKAGDLLREPEPAPAFDLRKELPEKFLIGLSKNIVDIFIHGEPSEGSGGVAAAYQLREQLEPLSVLNQALGTEVLPLDFVDQRLAERKIKTGLKDLSRVTAKLVQKGFNWWDAVEYAAQYHEASRVKRPWLLGDDVFTYIEQNMPTPHAGLDTHLALLRLRPDKRDVIRAWATRFDRLIERLYQQRTDPGVAPTFLNRLNQYLLIYPEKRDQFPLTEADRNSAHAQLRENFQKRGAAVLPTLWQQVIAFAQAAWIDEEGKIRVKMEAPQMKASPELPERPQV